MLMVWRQQSTLRCSRFDAMKSNNIVQVCTDDAKQYTPLEQAIGGEQAVSQAQNTHVHIWRIRKQKSSSVSFH